MTTRESIDNLACRISLEYMGLPLEETTDNDAKMLSALYQYPAVKGMTERVAAFLDEGTEAEK